MQEFPNYIQKMLDEFNAKNPPEALNEKRFLRNEIKEVLASLNKEVNPVFKEFADNPLAAINNEEINEFIDKANSNEAICKPAKKMIMTISNMHIYHSFCEMENVLRNNELNLDDLVIYDFILDDLVDSCYDVKKHIDISTKDLLCYTYYLGFKDYTISFFVPTLKYLIKHKPKFHLNISKRKRTEIYKIFQEQKDFILQDQTLRNMYKYFIEVYRQPSASLSFRF